MNEAVDVCPTCGGSGVVGLAPSDDQTLADTDQTASDQDQTWSDHDQSASDRDQQSAADDQEAADDDFAAGSDPAVHERTRLARARARQDREIVAQLRDDTADARLQTAAERDREAEVRDREARERDRTAAALAQHPGATREEILVRSEHDRVKAATDRAKAAEDRASAAPDRARAAGERVEALRAESETRHDLLVAGTDELTGVWTRRIGLANIDREIERARRTGSSLILIFIDVDGLKEVNDTEGHAAGDELLRLVSATVRANVRPYDVVVRYGGDEFLCAMPNLSREDARERMDRVASTLTAKDSRHSIGFGLAQHETGDHLDDLVNRADADLLGIRRPRES